MVQHVRGHERRGRPVRPYIRRGHQKVATLFHGTTTKHEASIVREGFHAHTDFTDNPEDAELWARVAADRDGGKPVVLKAIIAYDDSKAGKDVPPWERDPLVSEVGQEKGKRVQFRQHVETLKVERERAI